MVTMEELKARDPDLVSFRFGDGPELSAELIALVRSGAKTGTCSALRDFDEEPMPVVGRRDVALNWDGSPALMIETTEVTQRRFCDVDAEFALAEGEDETLESWREGHLRYFERNGGWDPEMMLVCERFRLVEDFA